MERCPEPSEGYLESKKAENQWCSQINETKIHSGLTGVTVRLYCHYLGSICSQTEHFQFLLF